MSNIMNEDFKTGLDSNQCIDGFMCNVNTKGLNEINKIWHSIYGENQSNLTALKEKLHIELETFWKQQLETQCETLNFLTNGIEKAGKEAYRLEKALDLPRKVDEIEEGPLIKMKEEIWKLLNSYKELRDKRLQKYATLMEQENYLCEILGESVQFSPLDEKILNSPSGNEEHYPQVPPTDDMKKFEARIKDLEILQDQLEHDFIGYKYELRNLLKECGIAPLSKVERYACSEEDSNDFSLTKQNVQSLQNATRIYHEIKDQQVLEADQLRNDIVALGKKMLKDEAELRVLVEGLGGFSKPIIDQLKNVIKSMREERKLKLKDLIIENRNLLDQWWTMCCYSDNQRAQFKAYEVDYYSEDVLELHEIELENVKMFYTKNKRIFQLAEKHEELWKRLLHLEDLALNRDRLFSNRGGQLLQEEKERKMIQKKLPAIKDELVTLLRTYYHDTGKDFLHFGSPLLETLSRLESEREAAKENQKQQRKAVNTETILIESKLGSRPGAKRKMTPQPTTTSKLMKQSAVSIVSSTTSVASSKSISSVSNRSRKMLAQRQNQEVLLRSPHPRVGASYAVPRTPVARNTPAASTPDHHGSPSYESFQAHLESSNVKEVLRSSSRTQLNNTHRVLRPKNFNAISKTPKTPMKTPSKIPFRIATGSKIPSVVPPLSPKVTPKLTTPRSRLPLIF